MAWQQEDMTLTPRRALLLQIAMPRANQNAQAAVAELSKPVLASMAEWLLRNKAFVKAVAEKTDHLKGVEMHHKFPVCRR
jgi:hypothetical protein